MSATTSWSIRLDDDSTDLESILGKIIQDSTETSKAETIELEKEIANTIKRREAYALKQNKRETIQQNIQARLNRKREELDRANEAYRAARRKTRAVSNKLYEASEQERNLKNSLQQRKSFIDNFAEVYTEDAFKNRAFMVMSIKHMIDPTFPVRLEDHKDTKTMTLSWVTGDTYIRGRDGENYDLNFGKFNVKVVLRYANGSRVVDTYISGAGNNKLLFDEYVHPHIRSNGDPCLGNVSRMLITHMANQDVAQVIYTITEYLCHYNERDPFKKLMFWGVANPQDQPRRSQMDQYLHFDPGPKRSCGLSESECFVHHTVSSSGECVHKSVSSESLSRLEQRENALKKLKEVLNGESHSEADSSV